MQDLTETSVTDAVLAQMAATDDQRLKQVMGALVRHLHDFAREVRLTPAEWLQAMGFLTRVGQTCTPARQEFILLSDVLGLSALVNLMHDGTALEIGTESSLLGPFYRQNAPDLPLGGSIAVQTDGVAAKGAAVQIYGRVTDTAGAPIPNASVQIWQTDGEGFYDLQVADGAEYNMRGNFVADEAGRFHLRSVLPIGYSIPMDGPVGSLVRTQNRHGKRPAHIHFLIGAPGHRELVTALYLADDPNIASDTVFGVSNALVVTPNADDPAAPIKGMPSIRYDFTLSRASNAEAGRVGADPASMLAAE